MGYVTAGWLRFFGWVTIGACLTLGIVSAAGVFLLPLAAIVGGIGAAVLYAAGRGEEMLGLLGGPAAVGIILGTLNLNSNPCTAANEASTYSCGGYDGTPWLVAGLIVMTVVVSVYVIARRSRSRNQLSGHFPTNA